MSDNAETDRPDRELWRRWTAETPQRSGGLPIDANDLAAWLDGRADQAATERVETALSADPDLLAEVASVRDAPPAEPVPESVLSAAKALAGRPRAAGRDRIIRGPWWQRMQWAAAAAAIVLACLGGYSFGQGTSRAERDAEMGLAQASAAVMELVSDDNVSVPNDSGNENGGAQ